MIAAPVADMMAESLWARQHGLSPRSRRRCHAGQTDWHRGHPV